MKHLILGDGKLATEIHKQTNWEYISRKNDGINFINIDSYTKYITNDIKVIINCIANTNTKDNTKKSSLRCKLFRCN